MPAYAKGLTTKRVNQVAKWPLDVSRQLDICGLRIGSFRVDNAPSFAQLLILAAEKERPRKC